MGDLPAIYKNLGPNFDDKVLPSIVNEVLKAVVARFNAVGNTRATELVRLDRCPLNNSMALFTIDSSAYRLLEPY